MSMVLVFGVWMIVLGVVEVGASIVRFGETCGLSPQEEHGSVDDDGEFALGHLDDGGRDLEVRWGKPGVGDGALVHVVSHALSVSDADGHGSIIVGGRHNFVFLESDVDPPQRVWDLDQAHP